MKMVRPIDGVGHSSFQTKKLKILKGKFQTDRKVAGRLIKIGVTLLVGKRTASQDKHSGFVETVLRFTVYFVIALILISTPAGRLSLLRASIVLAVA